MNFIYDALGYVFGPIMRGIFAVVGNYGGAVILFTIFCRLLMLPSAISQQKNQAKNTRMQFKMRKIQEKYKDDRQRLQEETQEFYRREGYNPMSAGCSGGMLIQFPIMFGLLAAIYQPLKYALNIPSNVLAVLQKQAPAILAEYGQKITGGNINWQLPVIQHIKEFHLSGAFTQEFMDKIVGFVHQFSMNFGAFSLELGLTPQEGKKFYYLIPVLAGVSAMGTSIYSFFHTRKMNPEQKQNVAMLGCMTLGMPLFSAWLAFSYPVGIGLYWIISSLAALIQMAVLNVTHPPQKMLAKVMVDETIERRSREESKKRVKVA
ncbi:MAG: YidC/Oxa1 family membrane protein insertase [Oscillospiraceae bacterium]|jgi:YidC/Oxa1 family membrane protein insertase|nr:YidC/Oxa1 family membrane protein insertase [Oscillospiraceae bacterium]